MRRWALLLTALAGPTAAPAGTAVEGLQATYRSEGAGPFSASRGAAAWQRQATPGNGEAPRSCATCHGADPHSTGRHARTGKPIEPLAPAVSPARLSDPETIEKWFRRNCEWTWGRACTPQEKGDFLTYITGGSP